MLRVGFHDAGSAAFRIGFTACTQRSFMITGRQVGHVLATVWVRVIPLNGRCRFFDRSHQTSKHALLKTNVIY